MANIVLKPSYVKKNNSLKNKNKKKVNRSVILFIVFSGLMIYGFLFSGSFRIQSAEVDSPQELKDKTIEIVQGILNERLFLGLINDNILFVKKQEMSDSIKGNISDFLSVEISKKIWPLGLKIKAVPREKIAVFCNQTCHFIDRNGIAFGTAQGDSLELLIEDKTENQIILGQKIIEPDFLNIIIEAKDIINENQITKIKSIEIPNMFGEFRIKTIEGWEIYLDKNVDIKTQLVGLNKTLDEKVSYEKRSELEYFDLRIDGRIYYK